MKLTKMDTIAISALLFVFVLGVISFDQLLIVFGALGILQYSLAVKVVAAINRKL